MFPGAYFAADFMRRQYRLNGVRYRELTSVAGISITRATTGYALTQQGQLVSFPSGSARITDRGLLVEGAATNDILHSQAFDNAYWTKGALDIGAATTAPDGTTTAQPISEDTSTAQHRFFRTGLTFTAAARTVSIYAKAGTATWLALVMADGTNTFYANFNLATGALGNKHASATSRITALANGWHRCEMTATTAATSGGNIQVCMLNTDVAAAAESYLGTSRTHTIWGLQSESTAYATSYIPTTAGSATRNADVISIGSVSGLAYPVTLFAEFEPTISNTTGSHAILGVRESPANDNNRALLHAYQMNGVFVQVRSGGVTQMDTSGTPALSVGTVYRGAARIQTNDGRVVRNGSLGNADSVLTLPAADPTMIDIGQDTGGSSLAHCYLRRLAIFPTAYTNAQLQALTA